MDNTLKALTNDGICIIGTPNETSSQHASHRSDHQHINLKNGNTMYSCLDEYFQNTFIFSMNDEVLHTGYSKMSNYYFIICINKKK